MLTEAQIVETIQACDFAFISVPRHREIPSPELNIIRRGADLFLQLTYWDRNVDTGEEEEQRSRLWLLTDEQMESRWSIITTAFKCLLTSAEHWMREHFLYQGERIMSPRQDADALVSQMREARFRRHADALDEWKLPQ